MSEILAFGLGFLLGGFFANALIYVGKREVEKFFEKLEKRKKERV